MQAQQFMSFLLAPFLCISYVTVAFPDDSKSFLLPKVMGIMPVSLTLLVALLHLHFVLVDSLLSMNYLFHRAYLNKLIRHFNHDAYNLKYFAKRTHLLIK